MSLETDHDEEMEFETDQEWRALQDRYGAIYDTGMSRYADELPHLDRAFILDHRRVQCIDEGTPGGLHLGGSGILLSDDEAARVLTAMQIEAITSHAGCGAAALAASRRDIPATDAEKYAQDWAERMARTVGVPYAGHIDTPHMKRPARFHNALAAYYDGTGTFDYSQVDGLPPGFIISRRIIPADVARAEASLATQIAFGHHGLGRRFTAEHPFLLINITDPNNTDPAAAEELQSVKAEYGDRVRIQDITKPS